MITVEIGRAGRSAALRHQATTQARQIASLEAADISYRTLDLQLSKLREVTPEQVREVARKYYRDDAITVATLDPQPLAGVKRKPPPAGLKHAQ